jgi:hypothetical protein
MIRIVAVLCAVLATAEAASALNCQVPRFHTLAGQTVDDFMTVKSGRRCSIVMLTSRGPTPTTRIVAPPAHCSAYIEAGNRIVYRSRPGYVNSDSFSYARGGIEALNKSITRTVQIGVTVTP